MSAAVLTMPWLENHLCTMRWFLFNKGQEASSQMAALQTSPLIRTAKGDL